MNNLKNSRVLITGASSGIGRAMALMMASKGAELFLLARRQQKLNELAQEIKDQFHSCKVHLIVSDINSSDVSDLVEKVTQEKIDILINNAGLALGREKIESSEFSDWEKMINTNVVANFRLVHQILPWMLRDGKGDIINLCSIAGHYTYIGGAVYCATKHAIQAFTRVLREETCGRNIRVMQISPGMVNTEFSEIRFRGNKEMAQNVYANMTPLTGEDIASMMVFMLERPRHVVIDEIITMPTDQGAPTTIMRGGN